MLSRRLVRWALGWVRGASIERSVASALALFRLASWALTSLMYVTSPSPPGASAFKIAVASLLLVAAVLSNWLLNRAVGDSRQIAGLAIAEAIALPAVLLPTGGIASPFVWYALNPLLVAAVYLPIGYTWGVVVTFLAASSAATAVSPMTRGQPLTAHAQVALILVLVTLTTRVQAQLLRRLEMQSVRIGEQSRALREAYYSLAVRGEALSSVLQFGREAIAAQSHVELYRLLALGVKQRFRAGWAGVLYIASEREDDSFDCPWLPDRPSCGLVEAGVRPGLDWQQAWSAGESALRSHAQDPLDHEDGAYVVAPLLVEDGDMVALFAVYGLDQIRRTELLVWLEYARQLAARIAAADRTRHTLDYLADVY